MTNKGAWPGKQNAIGTIILSCSREQQVALEHYECHLLLKTLLAWRSAGRLAGAHRRQLEDQQVHRRKMDALLRAAAAMKAKEEP